MSANWGGAHTTGIRNSLFKRKVVWERCRGVWFVGVWPGGFVFRFSLFSFSLPWNLGKQAMSKQHMFSDWNHEDVPQWKLGSMMILNSSDRPLESKWSYNNSNPQLHKPMIPSGFLWLVHKSAVLSTWATIKNLVNHGIFNTIKLWLYSPISEPSPVLLTEKILQHLGCPKCWLCPLSTSFGASQVVKFFFSRQQYHQVRDCHKTSFINESAELQLRCSDEGAPIFSSG